MKSELSESDSYCQKILLVLSSKGEMRFNELLRTVEKLKIASGPTFKKHIKHLVEAGFVISEKKGSQYTLYRLNESKFHGKDFIRMKEDMTKYIRNFEKQFFSLPVDEQVNEVLRVSSLWKLFGILTRIALELDPQSFEKQFQADFFRQELLEAPETLMIQRCVKDEKYRVEAVKRINELLDKKIGKKSLKEDFGIKG